MATPFAEPLRRNAQARANRPGQDMHYRLPVAFAESIAGVTKRLTLPTGGVLDVTLLAGMVDGQTLQLKGKGAGRPDPRLHANRWRHHERGCRRASGFPRSMWRGGSSSAT